MTPEINEITPQQNFADKFIQRWAGTKAGRLILAATFGAGLSTAHAAPAGAEGWPLDLEVKCHAVAVNGDYIIEAKNLTDDELFGEFRVRTERYSDTVRRNFLPRTTRQVVFSSETKRREDVPFEYIELSRKKPDGSQVPGEQVTVGEFDCIPDNGGGSTSPNTGYAVMQSDGSVNHFGSSANHGSLVGMRLAEPIVGAESTPSSNGYWMVAADGGIFSFGDAKFHGSTGHIDLNKEIVGMTSTPDGNGYWMVAADGGIFSFGNAEFFGSTGAIRLNKPIVGMATTPTGKGYWLVAEDGGIFSFGDAQFHGSTGAIALNKPIVGMDRSAAGNGYNLVASDGGIFSFGDAQFHGSTGAIKLNEPIVGMATTPSGKGYHLVAEDGGIFSFGDAQFHGSRPDTSKTTVGMISSSK